MTHPSAIRRVTAQADLLLAPNPGPMTLDGTNSYLLSGNGFRSIVVVDPGPADEAHLAGLAGRAPVELVLLTHRHPDHTAGAPRFAALTSAPVRAFAAEHCIGGRPLADGEVLAAAGLDITVVHTPGHTADSVCFQLPADRPSNRAPSSATGPGEGSMLTGDTLLGRGTTVLAPPDGDLAAYLASLEKLRGMGITSPAHLLPGHGPDHPDLATVCAHYLAHRRARLDQIREALAALSAAGTDPTSATVTQLTDAVYADIDPSVRAAAEASVRAQLDYLRAR